MPSVSPRSPRSALSRRRLLAGLSVVAATPVLAACGGEDAGATGGAGGSTGGSTGASGSASGGAEAGAFPATLTHKYGTTTVEAAPKRVVCVGYTDQDTLLALGVVPVGVTYWFGDEELQGIYPWADAALGDAERPTVLRDADGVQVERIAALAPDLIVGQYSGLKQADYDRLSQLAPVVAQSGEYADYGMPWDEMALALGTAVGRPAAVRSLIREVEGQIAEQAAAHPEFAGQTAAVVTPYEGLFLYGPEDPRSRMLTDLGFTLHPLITGAEDSDFGVSVSAERTTDLADIGVAVWLDLDQDEQVASLFGRTRAAEQGRRVDVGEDDGSYYVAHSFVTPLSIPYVLERYVPQLAAAADGDPATTVPAVTA